MLKQSDRALETKDTATTYFARLFARGWEDVIGEDIEFTSPNSATRGKAAYVEATNRFKRVARSVEVKKLIVEDENVCAMTRYQLQSPKGNTWQCDTIEVFSISDGKIQSSTIFFDTAGFGKFIAQG